MKPMPTPPGRPRAPEMDCTSGDLRKAGVYRVLSPQAYLEELRGAGPAAFVMLHPMVGGIPPERAWQHLRLFEQEVLPGLQR